MDFILYKPFRQFFNWLFPPSCFGCEKTLPKNDFCAECFNELSVLFNACERCGLIYSGQSDYCGHCLSAPPSYDLCFCPFAYDAPLSDLICRLKYADQPQLSSFLAKLFVEQLISHEIELPAAIIPVPMHKKNLRKRGYNQSLELAKQVGSMLNIPVVSDTLVKSKATPRQATQTLKQRKSNIKNSFVCKNQLAFTHVAILDDVITTGATVEEISKILKKKGVDYIQVWGLAHTL